MIIDQSTPMTSPYQIWKNILPLLQCQNIYTDPSPRKTPREGLRDAVGEMMAWLAPMAQDTVVWLVETAFEKMRFQAVLSSEFSQQIPAQIAFSITSTPQICHPQPITSTRKKGNRGVANGSVALTSADRSEGHRYY